jgi:hypothetical protein
MYFRSFYLLSLSPGRVEILLIIFGKEKIHFGTICSPAKKKMLLVQRREELLPAEKKEKQCLLKSGSFI